MKFGQLIEYNMRNIFVEKPYTKCAGETISRPLSKKSNLSIYLVAAFLFYLGMIGMTLKSPSTFSFLPHGT